MTVAERALELISDGAVVGLGTGRAAVAFVRALGERVRAGLRIRGVPTSTRTRELALALGIPLAGFDEVREIDVTIDGADEIDPQLRLIKGAGGALLREKIVASASRRLVIVADASKQVAVLGRHALPIEVIGFAEALVARRVAELGARVTLRQADAGTAYVTDEGHHILDCSFGHIADPAALAAKLDVMPGVVEHGLFVELASLAVVAAGEVVTIRSRDGNET